jgi:hypothetical protein
VGEEKWKMLQEEKQADFISRIKGRLSNFCDEISNEVDACSFQVDKIIVKEGIAADEILYQAELNDADVIVMGTKGYGMFKEALMGGTARRVVRRSVDPGDGGQAAGKKLIIPATRVTTGEPSDWIFISTEPSGLPGPTGFPATAPYSRPPSGSSAGRLFASIR